MTIVNERVRKSMYFYNAPELMATLDWSVQEDRSVLHNASKEVVRRRFRDWAANATGPDDLFTPRYRYCVQVGHDSLRYVVNDARQPPAPDLEAIGYVNVICADWRAEEEGDEVEGEEEVEGCRQMDVGWMKVAVDGLAPRTYSMLGESGGVGDLLREAAGRGGAVNGCVSAGRTGSDLRTVFPNEWRRDEMRICERN